VSPQNAIAVSGGRGRPLGNSAHTLNDIQHAATAGFDYATFSPIFSTQTHPEAVPAGIEALTEVCTSVPNFPVFALGGITPERAQDCLDAGAFGVAVLSDLLDAADPVQRLAAYRDAGAL
jgi:thiamine-phosphate pyrophosphorylase